MQTPLEARPNRKHKAARLLPGRPLEPSGDGRSR